jgi:hypothetical protein
MLIVMIFNMSTSCFHRNSFHYFQDYLMTKLILEQANPISKLCKFLKFILCVLFLFFMGYVGFGSCILSCVVGNLFQKKDLQRFRPRLSQILDFKKNFQF